MGYFILQPLFPLGELRISPGIEALGIDITPYLRRHQAGDWGEACPYQEENHLAVESNDAIISLYPLATADGVSDTICVMTESDRSYTVISLMGEHFDMPADE